MQLFLLSLLSFISLFNASVALWQRDALHAVTGIFVKNLNDKAVTFIQEHLGSLNLYEGLTEKVIELNDKKENTPWFEVKRGFMRSVRPFEYLNDCGEKCPVTGYKHAVNYLQTGQTESNSFPFRNTIEAIAFLIHVVADLSNPIHMSGFGDRKIIINGEYRFGDKKFKIDGVEKTADDYWNCDFLYSIAHKSIMDLSKMIYQLPDKSMLGQIGRTKCHDYTTEKCAANWGMDASSVTLTHILNDNRDLEAGRSIYSKHLILAGLRSADLFNTMAEKFISVDSLPLPSSPSSSLTPEPKKHRDKFKAMFRKTNDPPNHAPNTPLASLARPENTKMVNDPYQVPLENQSYGGDCYNSPGTFIHTKIDILHKFGLTGNKIPIHIKGLGDPDLTKPELTHTRALREKREGLGYPDLTKPEMTHTQALREKREAFNLYDHDTYLALVLGGALTVTKYRGDSVIEKNYIGVAPRVTIVRGTVIPPVIVSNSVNSENLVTCCEYQVPEGQMGPVKYLNPPLHSSPIYVVMAGNIVGPEKVTNMGWGVPEGFYPEKGNIIVTVGVNHDGELRKDSVGCGGTYKFCVAVPVLDDSSSTAPIVAGALALLMEAVPNRPQSTYVDAILNTAIPPTTHERKTNGVGLLDVSKALLYLYEQQHTGVSWQKIYFPK